jgi:hypothetical protein
MKSIKLAFALCSCSLLLAATGCGKSKAILAAEEYEKSACACKDLACATEASKKFSEHAKEMATMSTGETEAIAKATAAATECVTKASMAGIPGMPGMKK